MEVVVGFMSQNLNLPERRGERVAAWVEAYMSAQGCSSGEVAFRVRQDKRDVERLLRDRSCGPRLEDALAAYFGWTFVEAVMAPVIESSIEAEIAKERAEIAAREERLARLYRARQSGRPVVRLAASQGRAEPPPARRGA